MLRNAFVVYVPICIATIKDSCAVFKFLEATWYLLSFLCRCFCRKLAIVRANSLTLYNCWVDNFSLETHCANWSTDFSAASVIAFFVLPHTWCKLMPCRDFSLCSHPWQYSHSCWRHNFSQKICAYAIIMFLKIGTWSVQWCINCCITALHHSLLYPSFIVLPLTINRKDFIHCSSISYTVDAPTLWVLHMLCTDVLFSWLCSISTICCMDNTGFCFHALFSWAIFRSKHDNKLF